MFEKSNKKYQVKEKKSIVDKWEPVWGSGPVVGSSV